MKIEKLFILLLFISMIQIQGYAQTLVQEGAKWNILASYWFEGTKATFTIKVEGDTIVDNMMYKKIYQSSDSLNLNWVETNDLIREDLTKKVYLKRGDSEEEVLYDFNLMEGDTFVTSQSCELIVVEIDNIQIENGELRKRMKMSSQSTVVDTIYDTTYWIEGIGSLAGLLRHPWFHCSTDHEYGLLCYYYNSELAYQTGSPLGCFFTTNVEEIGKSNEIKIYPNPVSDILTIKTENDLRIDEVNIYSPLGVLVSSIDRHSISNGINLSSYPHGVYYVLITLENGQLFSKKILRSN